MSRFNQNFFCKAAETYQRSFDPDGLPVHDNTIIATRKRVGIVMTDLAIQHGEKVILVENPSSGLDDGG